METQVIDQPIRSGHGNRRFFVAPRQRVFSRGKRTAISATMQRKAFAISKASSRRKGRRNGIIDGMLAINDESSQVGIYGEYKSFDIIIRHV